MGTTSRSSSVKYIGRSLLLAHPIHGGSTFRPSGHPADEPERRSESELEHMRRVFGTETKEGQRAFDQLTGHALRPESFRQHYEYWDRLRFLQTKSPRARKRAEERERRRQKD
jgi:hypothetical protein